MSSNVIAAGDVSRTTGPRSTGPPQLDGPWVGPALRDGQGLGCPGIYLGEVSGVVAREPGVPGRSERREEEEGAGGCGTE